MRNYTQRNLLRYYWESSTSDSTETTVFFFIPALTVKVCLFGSTAINVPCSRTAWAPCGRDVAVGVSSSSRLVCGSDRPARGFVGRFSSRWLPLPALCHAPWRPWDLQGRTRRRNHSDVNSQPLITHFRLWATRVRAYGKICGQRVIAAGNWWIEPETCIDKFVCGPPRAHPAA